MIVRERLKLGARLDLLVGVMLYSDWLIGFRG